jgi:LacI family transcriptional regulator
MASENTPVVSAPPPSRRRRILIALTWYSINIHRGITRYAHDRGWILDGGYIRAGFFPKVWDGDGLITVMGVSQELDRAAVKLGKPLVNIGYDGKKGVVSVAADGGRIGRMAADHFRSRGFRHFVYVMWYRSPGETQRWEGFRDALAEHGFKAELLGPIMGIRDDQPRAEEYRWLGSKLAAFPKPVAAFCEYDDHAIRICDAALMAGLRVPEQVAILGVDNDELRCPFAQVPLSSIDNNEERIGFEAARVLDELLEGKPPPSEPLLIPPRGIVVRQSTNILAIPHEDVALALRLIWEHYAEPIDVSYVVDKVPLSYPQLHNAFVKYVGHTLAEELTRRRLEHAQRLLSDSDLKMSEVARLSGFGSADRMGRVFMRKLKMTPSEYRTSAATQKAPAEISGDEELTDLSLDTGLSVTGDADAKPALLRPSESMK